ncbi:MAG: Ig-like domain-containing protein, partial [Rhizobacter sp.]|nr:Ig-like domain-containing protein [Rhizobacter sp.]
MRRFSFMMAVAAAALTAPSPAQAASIVSVSPQGEVAQVRQITVKFSDAVVPFGNAQLPAPMRLSCTGNAGAATGDGRWNSDRVWVHDLRTAVPPGTRCTLTLNADWKPQGGALTGRSEFAFHTGGPAVLSVEPYPGSTIEEEQHFLLRLNGPAVEASVRANAWCEVGGIGERLAAQLVDGAPREALLKARRLQKQAANVLVLACPRPLPAQTPMRLVWGKGIAAAADPKVTSSTPQVFRYEVRKPFLAEFSCERERAGAPCVPVLPMSLSFSAPVSRALAAQVRLIGPGGVALAPWFDKDDKAEALQTLRFAAPLPANASFSIELPAALKDDAGRVLANASAFPLTVRTATAPPIAKFASAPFGIVEWHAESMLPLTLRHLQGELRPGGTGSVRVLPVRDDVEILQWYASVKKLDGDWSERGQSLLKDRSDVRRMDLPQLQGGDPRPFEVV